MNSSLRSLGAGYNIKSYSRNSSPCVAFKSPLLRPQLLNLKIQNSMKLPVLNRETCCKKIRIMLLSNWGHPDMISLSNVIVYGSDRSRIEIKDIQIEPSLCSREDLSPLIDGILIKSADSKKWRVSFDGEPIVLILSIEPGVYVKKIRLWNIQEDQEMGVRKIKIIDSDGKIARGEIQPGFGADIHLNTKVEPDTSTFNELSKKFPSTIILTKLPRDLHGVYPIVTCSILSFEIMSAHADSRFIGTNGICAFDGFGMRIEPQHIQFVNCDRFINSHSLLIPEKIGLVDPLRALVDWNKPMIISYLFDELITLSRVEIYNFQEPQLEYGAAIKGIKIRADGRLIWNGNIPLQQYLPMFRVEPTKTIWFCDQLPFIEDSLV